MLWLQTKLRNHPVGLVPRIRWPRPFTSRVRQQHSSFQEKTIHQPWTFIPGNAEAPEGYKQGGYHPVQLGEVLNDRYEVCRKLGNGRYGTTWLAKDQR